MLQLKVFYNIPQDDRCEVIFTEQAIDFPRIRVRPLLFTEYAIVQTRTGMWPHAFTFLVWQTKPRDQNRWCLAPKQLRSLAPKSTPTLIFEFAVYLFRYLSGVCSENSVMCVPFPRIASSTPSKCVFESDWTIPLPKLSSLKGWRLEQQ